jgi:2-amino-4-hydroxy-6-hydroxymethyldihydropteridine diphosphokinase
MATAYIGLGSNLGDRAGHIGLAVESCRAVPGITAVTLSPIYETAPVGPVPQGPFLNAAARLATTLSPTDLAAHLRQIETVAGREPLTTRRKWGPRVLDLDLLLYDDLVLDTPELTVPHPRLHERWFVLKPLADLAPDVVHPILGRTISDLLATIGAQAQ